MSKIASKKAGNTDRRYRGPWYHTHSPTPHFFAQQERKSRNKGRKAKVSKQELLKDCHQDQNVNQRFHLSLFHNVSTTESRIQRPQYNVQSTVSRLKRPESSVQTPASRVQRPIFVSRIQNICYVLFIPGMLG